MLLLLLLLLWLAAGEVCLPGGKRDPEDPSDEHTALREVHEEVSKVELQLWLGSARSLVPMWCRCGA